MFEIGWDFRRLFRHDAPTDGLTRGDAALLELLDFDAVVLEAKAADTAANRISARDVGQRRLHAAQVWREAARRSGDAVMLRKAAFAAEGAVLAFKAERRTDAWARARAEQGWCALLGGELFGDTGLDAAAQVAFAEARSAARGGLAAALADLGLATVHGRSILGSGDAAAAREAAERFSAPIAALDVLARRITIARIWAADARLVRADLLCGFGARLQDAELLKLAVDDTAAAARRVNDAYEPLTLARAETLRAQAVCLWGEAAGELETVTGAVTIAAAVLEVLGADDSPLDWARTQMAHGQVLQVIGEAACDPRTLDQAVTAFERAEQVLKTAPATLLRGQCAGARAVALARTAEISGDLTMLDAAEAAMKIELAAMSPKRDPSTWALAQLHLARLYQARVEITGKDGGRRAAAVTALDAALDVFAEQGQTALSRLAYDALERVSPEPFEPRTA